MARTAGKDAGGYTVIEVLIAVIILAIVLPGLAAMVVSSRQSQVTTLRFENGVACAQQVLDSLQRLPPSRVPATGKDTVRIDSRSYVVSWRRTGDPSGGATLEVSASWTVGQKEHSTLLRGALQ